MADKYNAKCPMCGKEFRICRTCADAKIASWKTVTDSINCFKIFTILHEVYVAETMDKAEAKEKLAKCDLSELDTFVPAIKKQVTDITGTAKAVATMKKTTAKAE